MNATVDPEANIIYGSVFRALTCEINSLRPLRCCPCARGSSGSPRRELRLGHLLRQSLGRAQLSLVIQPFLHIDDELLVTGLLALLVLGHEPVCPFVVLEGLGELHSQLGLAELDGLVFEFLQPTSSEFRPRTRRTLPSLPSHDGP